MKRECLKPASSGAALLLAFGVTLPAFGGELSLRWRDNSNDEFGFIVQRAEAGGSFQEVGRTAADVATFTDRAVAADRIYSYRVCAYNDAGSSAWSNVASNGTPTSPPEAARLVNLSVRARGGAADDALVVGFAVAGSSSSLLLRAVGPSLSAFGVAPAMVDPVLSLFSGPQRIQLNDDWTAATNSAALAVAFREVGAFPLPVGSRDAALLPALPAGGYSAVVSGKDNQPAIVLAEVYDARSPGARLQTLSARAHAGTGADALIVGFAIEGTGDLQLLLRAVGPSLVAFGLTSYLVDPVIAIYRAGEIAPLHSNDNWGGTTALRAAHTATGAFSIPDNSRDAALLVQLTSGSYTAHVTGVAGISGVALVEIYEVR